MLEAPLGVEASNDVGISMVMPRRKRSATIGTGVSKAIETMQRFGIRKRGKTASTQKTQRLSPDAPLTLVWRAAEPSVFDAN
jgi:hypothetical protein